MLFAELVATSAAVASTRARSKKIEALGELLTRLGPDEIEPAVGFLAGEPRQGKIGVGWALIKSVDAPPAAEATLTITDVDRALTELGGLSGPGSAGQRRTALHALYAKATAEEASVLGRLVLGELRQGALEGVMVDAVAKAAGVPVASVRRAVMLACDLPTVARVALTEGRPALEAIGLTLLRPVRPMLASTATSAAEAVNAFGEASVEWKLDGARVQAHRRGDEVRLFTRNANDVTERLPAVVAVVRALPVTDVVLDGEVLGSGDDERPDRFQETMSRFGRQDGGGGGLGVWFFDVLHLDGRDLIDAPLRERAGLLDRVAGQWRVPWLATNDGEAATEFLDAALEAGHEGVMVKDLTSAYEAGRRGKAWRKVKPVHTPDLVVLGAEWEYGRREGWLSNIHLGARDPAGGFVMVGKTFKGLTDALLTWQTARFQELLERDEGHVVFLRPELVVEIALDGVQASTRYPGGVALRFARVKRYRDDKDAADADTIEAVRNFLSRGG